MTLPNTPSDGWTLTDFLPVANAQLDALLPDPSDKRTGRSVSVRLLRHLTTLGLIDEPEKAGRESRYRRRHLLQLLVVRRLMVLGHTTTAIGDQVRAMEAARLEEMLEGEVRLETDSARAFGDLEAPAEMPRLMSSAEAVPPPSAAAPNAAARYVAQLRARGQPPVGTIVGKLWMHVDLGDGVELSVRADRHATLTLDDYLRMMRRALS